jgi:hypothetical protein
MLKSQFSKIIAVSLILFTFPSLFILVLEFFFPFTYISGNENYFFYTLLIHIFFLLIIFFLFKKKINKDLKINYQISNMTLVSFQLLSLLGLAIFVITKKFMLQPNNHYSLFDVCTYFQSRKAWLDSGGIEQSFLYYLLSPIGLLLVNSSIILIFINMLPFKISNKNKIINYLIFFICTFLLATILLSKNILLNIFFIIIIIFIINFIYKNKQSFLKYFVILSLVLLIIFSFFGIRAKCNLSAQNILEDLKSTKMDIKKNNLYNKAVINDLLNSPNFTYSIYYILHSKLNSDYFYNSFYIKKKSTEINHYLLIQTLNLITYNFFYTDFDISKTLKEKYNFSKPLGGLNLHIYLWHDYGFFGIILFNLLFLFLIFINRIKFFSLRVNINFLNSVSITSLIIYFHNILFSNLFVGIYVLNSLFLYFWIFIFFLFINLKKI